MKIDYTILLYMLLGLLLAGCSLENVIETEKVREDVGFTAIATRAEKPDADIYGIPHSTRNLLYVPDTVGVFVNKKVVPPSTPSSGIIMENALYRITNYKSNNFVSYNLLTNLPVTDANGEVIVEHTNAPDPGQEALVWYKTAHPVAYWDKGADIEYDIYAYAPRVETNSTNNYYSVSDNGIVNFIVDPRVGIAVDFIYAKGRGKTRTADAESLHMPFKHKLSKLIFKLKNSTENAITFYGLKYSIKYPNAAFDMLADEWSYSSATTTISIDRYMQKEIFENNEIILPEITTLLYPTDASNITGTPPAGVFVSLQICLNNRWYDVTSLITNLPADKKLKFYEGRVNELTFNCSLNYGINNEWNIFVATFDSFEYGGVINGTLE